MRAGCWQVIDISGDCSREAFRPYNGQSLVVLAQGAHTGRGQRHRNQRSCHLQPPAGLLEGWPSHVSLEGFRASQPKTADDAAGGGVPAPLSVASASARLRSHSQFRLPGQPASCCIPATLFSVAERRTRISPRFSPGCKRSSGLRFLDVSSLRWTHAGDREAHRPPDPTPFSAPSLRMGRMKPQLRTRLTPVFRHEPAACVSAALFRSYLHALHEFSQTHCAHKTQPTFISRPAPPSGTELRCLVSHFNSIQLP